MASAAPRSRIASRMAIAVDSQNGEAFQRVWGVQMRAGFAAPASDS